ncbi:MAG: hypothetical protein Q7T55_08875 [Solirubrobacteraceae bacterium]|nr:hypothetical protein [Solirubrobacteraceae bacterium]
MSTPPLPQLERELAAAARRLDLAAVPKRRRWLHGWTLVAVVVASSGVGVAAAQVGGLDPFAYLNGGPRSSQSKAGPVEAIAVQDDGREPAWQARAYFATNGHLCITGGPADQRTTPDATPAPFGRASSGGVGRSALPGREGTSGGNRTAPAPMPVDRNEPPYAGMTCSGTDSVAQLLVDPKFPGATFSGSNALNGHPDTGTVMWSTDADGKRRKVRIATVGLVDATRLLVYAVAVDGGPEPKVRFGATGPLQSMRASERTLRMTVDKSSQGLSDEDRRTVEGFPGEVALRLWAGVLEVPKGTRLPQTMVPERATEAEAGIIELLPADEAIARYDAEVARGKERQRGIERFPKPVSGVTAATKRWVSAYSRPHAGVDAVPERLVDDMLRRQRVGVADARRLTIAGGGLQGKPVWVALGGYGTGRSSGVCLVGAPVLGQCKIGTRRWKQPLVEAIVCSPRLDPKVSLVWGFAPRGTIGLEVVEPDGRRQSLPAREFVAIRRPQGERIQALVWRLSSGRDVRVRVPWPKAKDARCGPGKVAWTDLRRDNQGASALGHGGPWSRK